MPEISATTRIKDRSAGFRRDYSPRTSANQLLAQTYAGNLYDVDGSESHPRFVFDLWFDFRENGL